MNTAVLKAVYDATVGIMRDQSHLVPTMLLMSDQPLLRVVKMEYCPGIDRSTGARLEQHVADSARTIRDEHSDGNRWSGMGHGMAPDMGGLYVSLNSGALSAEIQHYNAWLPRNDGLPQTAHAFSKWAGKNRLALFRMFPIQGLLVVDLSKHSKAQEKFWEALDKDPAVKAALKSVKSYDAARHGGDYSCSRAVALGIAAATKPSYDGILVRTARDNAAVRDDGDNLVLFGRNGIHPKLTVNCVIVPMMTGGAAEMTLFKIGY